MYFFQKNAVINWITFLQNSNVEVLTTTMSVFGDGAFKEIIKVKWNHKEGWGPNSIELLFS